MADWLCDIVIGSITGSLPPPQSDSTAGEEGELASGSYSDVKYPLPGSNSLTRDTAIPHTRSTIHPSPPPVPEGFESAGSGRIVTFDSAQPVQPLIDRIGRAAGNPAALSIAIPQSASLSTLHVRTVGVCPGSGSGVLMKASPLPDLLLTGELSHHEALAATERGSVVITLFHSNTERGYLSDVMRRLLTSVIRENEEPRSADGFAVDVSASDRDPYGIVVLQR
jgi:import inner membrane translocase subunit TIM54